MTDACRSTEALGLSELGHTDGLVRPVTLFDHFSARDDDADRAVERIAQGGEDADAWPYSVWFENTAHGNERARSAADCA